MNRTRPSSQHRLVTVALVLGVVAAPLLAGCESAVLAYAGDAAEARTAASQLASSVQMRFDQPVRDERYEYGRMRLARYALAPSKVQDDTLWTSVTGSMRELTAAGGLLNGRYQFTSRSAVALPSLVGDSRHFISLDTLPHGDHRWRTQVDQAVGSVTPRAVGDVFTALLRAAERPAAIIRADYRSTMPRASASLGRLVRLDTVRTTALADGSFLVSLGMRLQPDRLAAEFPDFARYLRKYISPAQYRFTLRDRTVTGVHANDVWFVAEGRDDWIMLRFRSRDGALQPLEGPLRDRPDTLRLDVSMSVKFGIFTVGVRDLRGQFVFVNSPSEVGWDFRFATPPAWDLPPVAGQLVRGSLNRPFEGSGVTARLSVKRLPNGRSAIHRRTELAVSESAIMRWIGNLGFTAVDDFAGRVEQEEARFLSQAMRAMLQDLQALPIASGADSWRN